MTQAPAYLETKSHYKILDGLRGVAAFLVVIFHVLEPFANGDRFLFIMNHGYLAVDFFFLLSGFVVAYAYDDRWGKMTTGDFFKRRLVRLQPMVIVGTIIGAALFYFQASPAFPLIAGTPVWQLLLVMLFGFTMLPLPIPWDIRGWAEMHPLDGPAWSLYFEYIANILYALIVRRFSKTVLSIFVFLSACMLVHFLVTGEGDVIGGWALNGEQQHIGLARMLFPFFGGVLLFRMGKLIHIKNAFAVCSILILILFFIPRIGDRTHLWMNGLYESFVIIVMFPIIVAIGAGGTITGKFAGKVCKFFGDISYPLYITHYPLIYIFFGWVVKDKVPLATGLPYGLLLFVVAVIIAYTALKLYDEPVREWLKKKWLHKKAT